MLKKRYCIECKYFCLDLGTPDWSEVTPGDPMEITCLKGYFDYGEYDALTTDLFRRENQRALECKDFERVDYEWMQ